MSEETSIEGDQPSTHKALFRRILNGSMCASPGKNKSDSVYDDFKEAYSAVRKDHQSEVNLIPSTQLIVLLDLSAGLFVSTDKVSEFLTDPFARGTITRKITAMEKTATKNAYHKARKRTTEGEYAP
jgi:hypothetical protein